MPDQIEPVEGAQQNPPPEVPIVDEAPAAAAPKRRGRPPGSGKKTPEQIEAGNAAKTGATEKPGKRKSTIDDATMQAMGRQLVGLHAVAAMATGIAEMQLKPEEGYALAVGIGGVCNQYGLSLDGKTGAALQLAATMAAIYAPRLLSIKARAEAAQSRTVNAEQPQGPTQNGSVPTH